VALNGHRDRLSHEELEFVGATVHGHDTSGGWHQPADSLFELDSILSAEDAAILQSLMSVDTSQERLEFLGWTEGSPCGAGSRLLLCPGTFCVSRTLPACEHARMALN
jgi:hypothetical protein